ncbi:hypothetical protein DK847_18490 [Aestuariivirga litoralis]|uniref:DUF4304 domain-containing protein n=1 Tax=Aestuariivirga litoralis TaxID=2650924 RepID=A0A2W2C5T8_9HYPH|nr:DUF4304 domain-containing protein [Aestuariivirga litoralis]PZF75503.1 hypothetical protein DK847_18490 [Aestuariivirga litoralis]
MMDKVLFKKSFGNVLTEHGFRKKGQSWYLYGPDCIVVLNLQKDDFSALYFVNFGVWLLSLGDAQYPPENHCHVRSRLERLFPLHRELILDACTLSSDPSALAPFIALLHSDVVPLCQRCLSIEGLKEEVAAGRVPHYGVVRLARSVLGLPECT